jgi:hypothetical protein
MLRYEFPPMLGPAEETPLGSLEWAERISNRFQLATDQLSRGTAHHLLRVIIQIWDVHPRPWEIWPKDQPFGTPDDYCKAVTGHPWKALIELTREMGGEQLQFDYRNMEAELAKAQAKYRKQGTRTDQHGYDVTKLRGENSAGGGNSAAYLLRRLARDHPDILAAYERGEFKSVRQAGIAAGIVTVKKPLDHLLYWWSKASEDEHETFLREIEK